jgi:ParB family chromosome partitioning protein
VTPVKITNLNIKEVYPNPSQPRKTFDEEKLKELADSIKENGLIQPITVTKREDGYMIITGERRYRASEYADLETIKAIIIEVEEEKILEIALIENIQREDMNSVEVAFGYKEMQDSGLTVEKIAEKLGKKTQEIKFYLQLTKLDERMLLALKGGIINTHIAWELARLDDTNEQIMIFHKIRTAQLKAPEVGSFITAYINSKNQTSIFEPVNEKQKLEIAAVKETINIVIEKASIAVRKLSDKIEKNTDLQMEDHQIQHLELIGKSILGLVNTLAKNKRNSRLISELKAVV